MNSYINNRANEILQKSVVVSFTPISEIPQNWVLIAKILSPWSIKGGVLIEAIADWQIISKISHCFWLSFNKKNTQNLSIKKVHQQNNAILFNEVDNRSLAEKYKGGYLYAEEENLPKLKKGEFYYSQLVGLKVENLKAELIGEVEGINYNGAHEILLIKSKLKNHPQILIPLVKNYIQVINSDKIIVDWELDW